MEIQPLKIFVFDEITVGENIQPKPRPIFLSMRSDTVVVSNRLLAWLVALNNAPNSAFIFNHAQVMSA